MPRSRSNGDVWKFTFFILNFWEPSPRNIIKWVFSTLISILFWSHHWTNRSKSSCSSIGLQDMILVSSANMQMLLVVTTFGRLFTKTRKRSGPKIDPCGTPLVTGYSGDFFVPTFIRCIRLSRFFLTMSTVLFGIPVECRAFRMRLWSSLSKVLANSMYTLARKFVRESRVL